MTTRSFFSAVPFLAAGALGAYLFSRWHLPNASFMGPLVAAALLTNVTRSRAIIPRPLAVAGNSTLAVISTLPLTPSLVVAMGPAFLPMLGITIITLVAGMGMGYLLWRWAGVERTTGFLGCVPGMASGMVAMAADLGANPRQVAIIQFWRMLMVVVITPLVIFRLPFITSGPGSAAPLQAVTPALPAGQALLVIDPSQLALSLLALAAVGAAGLWLGPRLKLPAPDFLGPMAATLIVTFSGVLHFTVPSELMTAAMILLGTHIGMDFDLRSLVQLGRAALVESGLVLVLMAICGSLGYALHLYTGIDALSTLLGTAPGGLEAMVATAMESQANVAMVMSMQVLRMVPIAFLGPFVATFLARLAGRGTTPAPANSAP